MSFKRPDDGEAFVLYEVNGGGAIRPLRFTWKATPGAEYVDQGFWVRDAWERDRWCQLYLDNDVARRWDYVKVLIQLKGSNVALYRRQLRDAQRIARERLDAAIAGFKVALRDCEKRRRQVANLKSVKP